MMLRAYSAVLRLTRDIVSRSVEPGSIPIVYFTDRANVGDLLNEYIVPRVSGRNIVKVSSSLVPHLRAIGSVIGSSSHNSHIWGGGSIDGKSPTKRLDLNKIHALRGEDTRKLLSATFDFDLKNIPLGDPAVLMRDLFYPSISTENKIGIVPHFSDEDIIRDYIKTVDSSKLKVISVAQGPESFILELLTCDFILSSSLHGLILSDTYGIPNKWLKVSNKLLGGDFKFKDYYTTTDAIISNPIEVTTCQDFVTTLKKIDKITRVNKFRYSKQALLNSFPKVYKREMDE